jgi:hypothetical protein
VEPILERGDGAQTGAAAQSPVEVGILGVAGGHVSAVRGHGFERDHIVRREAVLVAQPTDAAAEREPGDPRLRDDAERCRQAVSLSRCVELAQCHAGLGARRLRCRVDVDRLHCRQVDDEAAVVQRIAGDAVPAAACRDPKPVLARVVDSVDHVGRRRALRNRGRTLVDHPVPERAGLVVGLVAGFEERCDEAIIGHRQVTG